MSYFRMTSNFKLKSAFKNYNEIQLHVQYINLYMYLSIKIITLQVCPRVDWEEDFNEI